MNMYEDGDLKHQKLSKKQLTTVPEFKQHHMQPLHNLQVSFQSAILQRVIDKEISLKEMKDEADNFRALEGNNNSMSLYKRICTVHLNFLWFNFYFLSQ